VRPLSAAQASDRERIGRPGHVHSHPSRSADGRQHRPEDGHAAAGCAELGFVRLRQLHRSGRRRTGHTLQRGRSRIIRDGGRDRGSRNLALFWLVLASLFFYAWWRPINGLIIAPSIAINYALARALQRLVAPGDARLGTARAVLALGIVFNVCFLGYFKYIIFLETIAH